MVMNMPVINNKSHVLLSVESYETLQKNTALKTKPEKPLSIEEVRAHSNRMIKRWAGGEEIFGE